MHKEVRRKSEFEATGAVVTQLAAKSDNQVCGVEQSVNIVQTPGDRVEAEAKRVTLLNDSAAGEGG
jgi:hypothetical protein